MGTILIVILILVFVGALLPGLTARVGDTNPSGGLGLVLSDF